MRKYFHLIISTLILMDGFVCSCSKAQNTAAANVAKDSTAAYAPPEMPKDITDPQERATYYAMHYWDKFNFKDTVQLKDTSWTEQAFANYLGILPQMPYETACESIKKMLQSAETDSTSLDYFLYMAEHYIYDPNSPMRNEDLYVPVIQYIIDSPKFDEAEKIRPQHQLKMIRLNHTGDIAKDFTYVLPNGKNARMHQLKATFTLLFFNNPDCHDCARVKEYMAKSNLFNMLTQAQEDGHPLLAILGVYPDDDTHLWAQSSYPSLMINSFDRGVIRAQQLYDLRAIPCLYLLDKEKRVILKDPTVEQVEMWLAQMMQQDQPQP